MEGRQFYVLAFFVQGLFLLFFYGQAGIVEMDKALLWCMIITGLILIGRGTILELKHRSPQIVATEFSDSFGGEKAVKEAGMFRVIQVGGWQAMGLQRTGNNGTVIVPEDAITQIGNSLAINCEIVKKKNKVSLPNDVYKKFHQLDVNKPVYAGYGTEEQKQMSEEELKERYSLSTPDVSRLETMYENQNEFINQLQEMLSDKTESIEQYQEHVDRMQQDTGEGTLAQIAGQMNDLRSGGNTGKNSN